MEYVLHYTNGAEGYLAHSGVKGMKWGVWNAETAARYSGRSVKGQHAVVTSKREKNYSNKSLHAIRKRDEAHLKAYNAKKAGDTRKETKYKKQEKKYQQKHEKNIETWKNDPKVNSKQSFYYKNKSKNTDRIAEKADRAVEQYKKDPSKRNERKARAAENARNRAQLDLIGTKTSRDNIRYSNAENAYKDKTVIQAAKFMRNQQIAANVLGLIGSAAYTAAAKKGRAAYAKYMSENSRIK